MKTLDSAGLLFPVNNFRSLDYVNVSDSSHGPQLDGRSLNELELSDFLSPPPYVFARRKNWIKLYTFERMPLDTTPRASYSRHVARTRERADELSIPRALSITTQEQHRILPSG